MKLKRPSKGIALLMVLTAIVMLSAAGVDLAYNMNTAYHLANNELDRLQAEYLAKSAVQLTVLELKYDKVFQQVIQQQNVSQMLGDAANLPLCKQFPISTGLIRTLSSQLLSSDTEGESSAPPPSEAPAEDAASESSGESSVGAVDFLNFDGDFDADCEDEATKFNVNVFATLNPEQKVDGGISSYGLYKAQLIQLLKNEKYKELFEASNIKPEDVVRNIADWVDENTQMNEGDGSGSGAEESVYSGNAFKIKNDKFSTIDELYYVAGVSDSWFPLLRDKLTIYGDGKVNLCAADENVVRAVIERIVASMQDLPTIRLNDDEVMKRLLASVTEACAGGGSGDNLSAAITQKLLTALATETGLDTLGMPPGAADKVREVLSTKSRYFQLKGTGQVRDMTVRISAVVDTLAEDPRKWTFVYWKEY